MIDKDSLTHHISQQFNAELEEVRSHLLAAQADASPEITSRITPDTVRPAASNPLIDAAKQIAAQSTAFKKEI